MSKSEKMWGRQVSEEEAAAGLGFNNVIEFRRWQTEQGYKINELEYALKSAERERDRFQSIGKRMVLVLNKIAEHLKTLEQTEEIAFLLLAIGVETGREADWGGKVYRWLKDIEKEQSD